jgi:hypothetical protein
VPDLQGRRDRPDQPGVDRQALVGGGPFGQFLQRFRQPQRDAGHVAALGHRRRRGRRRGRRRPVGDDEFGVATAQPHLDARPVELRGDLGRGVGQRLEQAEPGRRLERGGQQFRAVRGGFAGGRCGCGEIAAKRFQVRREVHDTIMTSFMASRQASSDVRPRRAGR